MSDSQELDIQIKRVLSKAESAVLRKYSSDKSLEIIHRLRQVMNRLNFNTHKKSVAIFLSQAAEKIMYLDLSLKEYVEVAGDFSMRDLVLQKTSRDKFLVLVMEGERSRIYDVNNNSFKLVLEQPRSILRQLDYGLSVLRATNPFPVIVLGAKKLLYEFSKFTSNASGIVQYISSYKTGIAPGSIQKILAPYLNNQGKIFQLFLEQRLSTARDSDELLCGLENVQVESGRLTNGLLLVDRDFRPRTSYSTDPRPFYIHDEVDRLIEKTLANGGDVEMVDHELLKEYGHIALIQQQLAPDLLQNQRYGEESCFEI